LPGDFFCRSAFDADFALKKAIVVERLLMPVSRVQIFGLQVFSNADFG